MASVPSFKIENVCNGKKCHFEIKINTPDNDNNANFVSDTPQATIRNRIGRRTVSNIHLVPSEYEIGSFGGTENPDGGYSGASDSDSGVESVNLTSNSVTKRGPKLDGRELFISQSSRKRKHVKMHLQSTKYDEFKHVVQNKVTHFFKKHKMEKISKRLIKGPINTPVFVLGSYFEGVLSEAGNQMNHERNRFNSYYNYTGNGNPMSLARNGFYHDKTESSIATRCFACHALHTSWSPNADILQEHRSISPQCPFLASIEVNDATENTDSLSVNGQLNATSSISSAVLETQRYTNKTNSVPTKGHENQERSTYMYDDSPQTREQVSTVPCPVGVTQQKQGLSQSQISQETCRGNYATSEMSYGLKSNELSTFSSPNGLNEIMNPKRSDPNMPQRYFTPAREMNNPKHPDNVNLDARLSSYRKWPQNNCAPSPQELAKAGFFFAGVEDCVRCFQCDVVLKDLKEEDSPIEEHARRSPQCQYIKKLNEQIHMANVQSGYVTHVTKQQRHQIEGAHEVDDRVIADVKEALREMEFPVDSAREAVLAVRQQTGSNDVTVDQAVSWFLDEEESRSDEAVGGTVPVTDVFASSRPDRVCTVTGTLSYNDDRDMTLETENQRLKQMSTCKICFERQVNVTLLPCGHLVCCDTCILQTNRCPACKHVIKNSVPSYMS